MPGVAPSKIISCGVFAPAHFQHDGLPADGVGRAVQNIRRRHAARQRAVDRDVFGVDDVLDIRPSRRPRRCLR